tara:strand:+ start:708 stop:1010 length:303 start_codon:yes stop_codon:yes gene_type:complete
MNYSGNSATAVARTTGVHPSMVSRELGCLVDEVPYRYVTAGQHAKDFQWKGQSIDESLLAIVEAKLREHQWSLEQISAWIVREDLGSTSHETIYPFIDTK